MIKAMHLVFANILIVTLTSITSVSASEIDEDWDVNNPPYPTRAIDLNVTTGTWMNVDVSPDGKTVVFDMLGDVYSMPITGGEATAL